MCIKAAKLNDKYTKLTRGVARVSSDNSNAGGPHSEQQPQLQLQVLSGPRPSFDAALGPHSRRSRLAVRVVALAVLQSRG